MRKYDRQRLILSIIEKQDVETQEELTEILKQHGAIATQATISRDIKELRVTKLQTPEGIYKYTVLDTMHDSLNERLNKVYRSSLLSVKRNRDMIIVKTISYTATVCGLTITNAKIEGIAGIITGHDTVFIEVHEGYDIDEIIEEIRNISL
ncbi:MAG: arginine repressor [Tissierellia bacterium]|nr:arginine repressor [Tissierellia bacterium]